MEAIAKVFRGKENRKHVDLLAKEVRRALIESARVHCPYSQDLCGDNIPLGYSVKDGFKEYNEEKYFVFYGHDVIANYGKIDFETAVELITCTVIAHMGMRL